MFDVNIIVLCLSIFSSLCVLLMFLRQDKKHSSRLVYLALYLILTDGAVALLILIQKIDFSDGSISVYNDDDGDYQDDDVTDEREHICRVFHPIMIFLFDASFGWTILIAIRFTNLPFSEAMTSDIESDGNTSMNKVALNRVDKFIKKYLQNPPFYCVPIGAFILCIPLFILNSLEGTTYSSVVYPPSWVGDRWCIFSNEKPHAVAVNYICFQIPCVATIVINSYFYLRGLHALRHAPMSVIAREASRAQSYIIVLLVVWLPGWISNLLGILGGYEDDGLVENILLPIVLMLQSGQGLWNTVVYVIGTKVVSRFLKEGTVSGSPMKQPLMQDERFVRFGEDPERHSEPAPQHLLSIHDSLEGINEVGRSPSGEVNYLHFY